MVNSVLIIFFLGSLLVLCQYLLLTKENYYFKVSSYECGFLTSSKSSSQISVQYFLLLILFMLFDLEVILLLPMLISMSVCLYFLLFFMVISLFYEWKMNQTVWVI